MGSRRHGLIVAAAGLAVVGVLPLLVSSRYGLNLLTLAAACSMATLGLTLLLGFAGQLSLAQASFYGIGAYAVALGTARFGLDWWVAMPVGLVVAALAGLALGATTLKVGGHYLAMLTISFQIIFSLVVTNAVALSGGADGVSGVQRPSGLPLETAQQYAWFALIATWLVALAVYWLEDTALGRAMRAVRENEIAAEVLGIDTVRIKVIAFALSAVIAALAGAVYASGFRYISPDSFNLDHSVELLAMALAGGSQSVLGSVLGSALLALLPEWLRDYGGAYMVVYGAIIVLVVVFAPEGLAGLLRRVQRRFLRPKALPTSTRPLTFAAVGAAGEPLLVVEGLAKHFGGVKAVDGVDFTVRRGEIHALIGPNGSGKSTCINLLSGLYVPSSGRIRLLGHEVQGQRPHQVTRTGVSRTFQNIRLLRDLTVWENVLIGAQLRPDGESERRARAIAALELVGVAAHAHERCGELPYGTKKLVEIARAIAAEPSLLLLDEPAAGLNPSEKVELGQLLSRLHDQGLTLLLVEHDMSLVARLASSATVLCFGKRIAAGAPRQVLADPVVIEAYLGKRSAGIAAAVEG